jgi:DNA anti-recombination protein RmuC
MSLAAEDIQFIKDHLGEWLVEASLGKPPAVYEIELRERMVRVEEELKHQRELMLRGFENSEKRFEQVDKRFEALQEEMNRRFDASQEEMNRRFDESNKRFEALQEDMNRRFEQVDKRFDELNRRMDRFMVWSFGTTVSVGGLVVALLKFWN